MDSVTHILFGGIVAGAGFRSRLGRCAVAAGSLINTLPDLDVFHGLFGHAAVTDAWQHHRAITHSLPATLIYGTAVGWMIWKAERLRRPPLETGDGAERRRLWMWLGALSCISHPLIDLFTSYGTQLLAPFSSVRFAINAMPIIDPVYTLPLLIIFLFSLITRKSAVTAQRASQLGLLWLVLYTAMAWGIGLHMERRARDELLQQNPNVASAARIDAYPLLLQPWWRRIVADTPDEILIGFASPFGDLPIRWQRVPRPDRSDALAAVQATQEATVFRWFADGKLHWRLLPDAATDNPGGLLAEARDYRYGMPGDSILGYWGLRFRVDAQNRVLGTPVLLSERPPVTKAAFQQTFEGLIGR